MGKCSFQDEWLMNPSIKSWLRKVPEDKYAGFCMICNCKFSLSNMGLTAVKSHSSGKKHLMKVKTTTTSEAIGSFFKPHDKRNIEVPAPATSTSCIVEPARMTESPSISFHETGTFQRGMEKFLHKEEVISSEIMWCLETVMTHKSLRSAETDVKTFPKLFPDSDIAKAMQLGRDKIAYTIVYGIAPHFKTQLIDELLLCDNIVLGFDESLNKVIQKQQMDINVRYWDNNSNEVRTRYLCSAFLGRSQCTNLLDAFINSVQPLDLKKLLQLSMDGPNVNKSFFKNLSIFLKDKYPEAPALLDLGSCGLHTLNVAFKTGAKATGWDIVEFHRALYYLFKDSPARRALYSSHTNSDLFPLKFCSMHWLENSDAAERSMEMLPHLKLFIKAVEKEGTAPTNQNYLIVKKAINDELLSAKLSFFRCISADLESYLREFQTDAPLVPFIHCALTALIHRLMQRFVKKEVLDTTGSVMNVNINDKNNLIATRNITVGVSTQLAIRKTKRASDKDIMLFRDECRKFLQSCAEKMKKQSPLAFQLTKAVSCFDPTIALKPNIFSKRLSALLLILTEKNWLDGIVADQVQRQLEDVCSKPHVQESLKQFRRSTQRVDHFWRNCDESIKVLKMIMVLSHGNANLERGFSINNNCLWDNMKEESLVARRIVFDHIMASGGLQDFEITKGLIHSARAARARFAESIASRKKEDVKKKSAANKRKIK